MTCLLSALVLALFICSSTRANVTVEYQPIEDGQSPHCVDREGANRSLGETWLEKGQCSKTRCLANIDNKAVLQIHGCNKTEATLECEVVVPAGANLMYPDCCPRLNCQFKGQ